MTWNGRGDIYSLPYCQDCVIPQTVVHASVECPTYSEERRRHFGPGPYNIKTVLLEAQTALYGPVYVSFLTKSNLYK